MKHVSALFFPETEPSLHTMAKLLIFFDSLSYYQPTESVSADNKDINFLADLCTSHVPAPLPAEELYRFNRLLREMETSRPDELARLFSAATAPQATGQTRDQDETSASRVYSTLQTDAETKTSNRHKELLWQARLILKLAEILDRREVEVRHGLTRVSSMEKKVFAVLDGRHEPDPDAPAPISSLGKPEQQPAEYIFPAEPSFGTSNQFIPLRIKAWAELFLADSVEQQSLILVTANQECGSTLLTGYENFRRREAAKLFSLSIPSLQFTGYHGAKYIENRKKFRKTFQANIKSLEQYLQKTADSVRKDSVNQDQLSELTANISSWEENLQGYFPIKAKNFSTLDFYSFPGISFAELFQKIFHPKPTVPAKNQQDRSAILAILTT
jgi:hypothetical protein